MPQSKVTYRELVEKFDSFEKKFDEKLDALEKKFVPMSRYKFFEGLLKGAIYAVVLGVVSGLVGLVVAKITGWL